jgi:hypothetical protein
MASETFIVGGREFTVHQMNAFAANTLLIRLQKIILPVIGSLSGQGGVKSIMDMDLSKAAQMMAEHIDETAMKNIVLPLLDESKLFHNEARKFIKSEADINATFTVETLFDFYELVWLIGRYQFAPFIGRILERFGSPSAEVGKT